MIVYRLPNKIKDIINGLMTQDADGNFYNRQVDESPEQSLYQSYQSSAHNRNNQIMSTRERAQLQNFTDSYNYSMND